VDEVSVEQGELTPKAKLVEVEVKEFPPPPVLQPVPAVKQIVKKDNDEDLSGPPLRSLTDISLAAKRARSRATYQARFKHSKTDKGTSQRTLFFSYGSNNHYRARNTHQVPSCFGPKGWSLIGRQNWHLSKSHKIYCLKVSFVCQIARTIRSLVSRLYFKRWALPKYALEGMADEWAYSRTVNAFEKRYRVDCIEIISKDDSLPK
jgi:hypothetical protein